MSQITKMTPEQAKAIEDLRSEGFAVVVFYPQELGGADPDQVQDLMIERGWNAIDTLKDPKYEV